MAMTPLGSHLLRITRVLLSLPSNRTTLSCRWGSSELGGGGDYSLRRREAPLYSDLFLPEAGGAEVFLPVEAFSRVRSTLEVQGGFFFFSRP
jgi:hypothetical protein